MRQVEDGHPFLLRAVNHSKFVAATTEKVICCRNNLRTTLQLHVIEITQREAKMAAEERTEIPKAEPSAEKASCRDNIKPSRLPQQRKDRPPDIRDRPINGFGEMLLLRNQTSSRAGAVEY